MRLIGLAVVLTYISDRMNRKPGHVRARLLHPNTGFRSTRRAFLLATAAWPALVWMGSAFGQSKQPLLIGWLHAGSRESNRRSVAAFKEGLAALGWEEGSQVVIDERWADGRRDRLPALAGNWRLRDQQSLLPGRYPPQPPPPRQRPRLPSSSSSAIRSPPD
jgi:hypothetical protein